jgi:hypothetical protein
MMDFKKDDVEIGIGGAAYFGFEVNLNLYELAKRISNHLWENLRVKQDK